MIHGRAASARCQSSSAKLQFSAIKTKLKNQKTSKQHSIAVMNQKNSYLCHIIINTNTIISAHIPRMDVNKVLYISQEIEPYLPASPLASFGKICLREYTGARGEVRTFMPRYGAINERRNQLHEVIRLSGMNIIIDDTDHPSLLKWLCCSPQGFVYTSLTTMTTSFVILPAW